MVTNGKAITGLILSGASGLAVGGVLGYYAGKRSSKKRSSKKRNKKSKNRKVRSNNRKGRRTPHTAGRGRDTSIRRIRYTKNRQPYIILRSGKARFISKKSARSSHKRIGGRY